MLFFVNVLSIGRSMKVKTCQNSINSTTSSCDRPQVMSFYNLRSTDKLEGLVQVPSDFSGPWEKCQRFSANCDVLCY